MLILKLLFTVIGRDPATFDIHDTTTTRTEATRRLPSLSTITSGAHHDTTTTTKATASFTIPNVWRAQRPDDDDTT